MVSAREPGFLLGFGLIVGSFIASLAIRRHSLYVLIPLPALTYLVLAIVTGYAHDHALGSSTEILGTDFLQWIGGGFSGICVATILVLIVFGTRLVVSRQLVSGQFSSSSQRSGSGRFPRTPMSPPERSDRGQANGRGGRAPWESDPWNDDRGGRPDREQWDNQDDQGARDRHNPRGDRDPRGGRNGRDGRGWDEDNGRDAWYDRPSSAGRGTAAQRDQEPTRAAPPARGGSGRDVPPRRTQRLRRDNDDWQ